MLSLAPIVLLVASAPEALQQPPRPTTFFIVRHADRDGASDALSSAGRRRAAALRDFMKLQEVRAVYSTKTRRTMDTATPTAKAAHRDVLTYGANPLPDRVWFQQLAKQHQGESVLIVGHSNTVVEFVHGFGARMEYKIDHSDYRSMFVVCVQPDGSAQAVRINYGPSLGIVANDEKQPRNGTSGAPVAQPANPRRKTADPESAVIK